MKPEERASANKEGVSVRDPDEMTTAEILDEATRLTKFWQDFHKRIAAVEAELKARGVLK